MAWPSKNPDDYVEASKWDATPPRWVARRRGQPAPDPSLYWISLCASFGGFIAGGVLGEAVGWDAMTTAWLVTILAQMSVQLGWRLKHQQRRHGTPSS